MIYRFNSFWLNFLMMTSWHGARISTFRENSFIKKYLTSKFLLVLIFILTIRTWDISLGTFSRQLWVDDVTTRVKTAIFWKSDLMKFCSSCVLEQVLFSCTNFCDDWLKTCVDIRNLVFLPNEELYKKFAAVPNVCQRWRGK